MKFLTRIQARFHPQRVSYEDALVYLPPHQFSRWVQWKIEHDRSDLWEELIDHETEHHTLKQYATTHSDFDRKYVDVIDRDTRLSAINQLAAEPGQEGVVERSEYVVLFEALTAKMLCDYNLTHGLESSDIVPYKLP